MVCSAANHRAALAFRAETDRFSSLLSDSSGRESRACASVDQHCAFLGCRLYASSLSLVRIDIADSTGALYHPFTSCMPGEEDTLAGHRQILRDQDIFS